MAAYFHGSSEIQADSLQTLYLMNPNDVGYSDTQPPPPPQQQPTNMLLLNPSSVSHAPPANTQHFVGIPLTGPGTIARSSDSDDPSRQMARHDENPDPNPSFHYNLWGALDQSVGKNSLIHMAPHSANALQGNNSVVSGFRSPGKQALSLSLSSQQVYKSVPVSHELLAGVMFSRTGEVGASSSSVSAISNGIYGMQSAGLGNKYLQAAQELLDEVVDVGKTTKDNSKEGPHEKSKNKESIVDGPGGDKSITKGGTELTTSERQELLMKKAKLVSMLDEVEQRYRQYHHQMQIVVHSFEQAAGLGSAKSYTSLALQTISKQFRCLKDAISAQIKAISNSLGEVESIGGKLDGSRLKFVDHHLRQQRALQQMGIMQPNAWRPQRGLPERAVSVLRAWLFEHFLHPYPKDSDKHMLAKQTGLTRSQVSNWFINARVRLWKPMVEEMYMEELKEQQQNGGTGCPENTSKGISKNELGPKSTIPQEITTLQLDQPNTLKSHKQSPVNHNFSPTQISTSNVADRSPKKPRSDMLNSPSSILDMKPGPRNKGIHESTFSDERLNRDGYQLLNSEGTGFGSYPIGELERFSPQEFSAGFHGNGVSLTLGLPHCDNLSISPTQQINLPNQNIPLGSVGAHYNEINLHNPQPNSHSNNGTYDNINFDHNRKRFATQLFHDFVA